MPRVPALCSGIPYVNWRASVKDMHSAFAEVADDTALLDSFISQHAILTGYRPQPYPSQSFTSAQAQAAQEAAGKSDDAWWETFLRTRLNVLE